MNRGRPRHDDVLTPREWEVLDLLKQGLTNEEIAERLGVAHNTVKYHVSEILSKLDVQSRQEAAAWRGRPRVAFGFAPVAWVLQKVAAVSPWKLAGAGAIGVAGAGLAALALGVLVNSGSQQPPSQDAVTVPVQWEVTDELPPPVSWEAPRPFGDVLSAGEDVWRAYVLRPDADAELILETNRYLEYGIDWLTDDEVLLHFMSRKESSSGRLYEPIHGVVAVDPRLGSGLWERITDSSRAQVSPNGDRLLVNRFPQNVYVGDIGGRAMKLEGVQGGIHLFPLWSPDNERFLLMGYEDATTIDHLERFVYVLTPGDPMAIKLDTKTDEGHYMIPRWSPDGSLLVYPDGNELVVIEVASKTLRRVAMARPGSEVPLSVLLWSEDGRYVTYGGGVFDVKTGEVVAPPDARVYTRLSPDSRYMVASSDPDDASQCPAGPPGTRSNRTVVRDLDNDTETEVLSCQDVPYTAWQWLDNERVFMSGSTCVDCPTKRDSFVILNVRDGSITPVEAGPEPDARRDFASDGRFLFATATSISMYSAEGALLAVHASPDGQPVREARWSPDGRSIVFTTGPAIDLQPLYQPPE